MINKSEFLLRYEDLHNRLLPTIYQNVAETDLRRSNKKSNPILWLFWHMLRVEDVGVNRFVLNKAQIYEAHKTQFGIEDNFVGTGFLYDEVIQCTERLNLFDLINYQKALFDRTKKLVEDVDEKILNAAIHPEQIETIICKEKTMPERTWHLLDLYYSKTKAWFLLHTCITHHFYHLGQISVLKKSL